MDDGEFSGRVDGVDDVATVFLLHSRKKRGTLVRLTAASHRTHVHPSFVWVVGDGRTKATVGEHGQEWHAWVHRRKELAWDDGIFSVAVFA